MSDASDRGVGDPATILVVEDDPSLRTALVATLKAAGLRPVPAINAAEAARWFRHYRPDVILLDLGLPDGDGLEVITDVRAQGTTPIVVLSARDGEATKVEALDRGADDYVTKPFGIDELLARIRAALRHAVQAKGSAPAIRTGDLEIDMGLRTVRRAGQLLKLSPKEYDLIAELALNLGRPVPHGELLKAVWGSEKADIQYLRVYIGQLRRKLEAEPETPVLLLSEGGVGYRLAAVTPP
jgi:two-component system KDP operon response regulator KdpE